MNIEIDIIDIDIWLNQEIWVVIKIMVPFWSWRQFLPYPVPFPIGLVWTIYMYMGGCQNYYGPFLGPLNTRCRITFRTQKGTIVLTTTQIYIYIYLSLSLSLCPFLKLIKSFRDCTLGSRLSLLLSFACGLSPVLAGALNCRQESWTRDICTIRSWQHQASPTLRTKWP